MKKYKLIYRIGISTIQSEKTFDNEHDAIRYFDKKLLPENAFFVSIVEYDTKHRAGHHKNAMFGHSLADWLAMASMSFLIALSTLPFWLD